MFTEHLLHYRLIEIWVTVFTFNELNLSSVQFHYTWTRIFEFDELYWRMSVVCIVWGGVDASIQMLRKRHLDVSSVMIFKVMKMKVPVMHIPFL